MKRIIGFAFAMALTASAVFAQNLTLGGYFGSGLGMVKTGNEDPFLKTFSVDSDSPGYRFRLNGSYLNEPKNAGFRFRIQSQRTFNTSTSVSVSGSGTTQEEENHTHDFSFSGNGSVNLGGMYFSMPFVYGFINFFENKLSFSAGIVDDSSWQTADWWFNDDAGEGLGVFIKLNPFEGFNLGLGAYTVTQLGGGANNVLGRNINSRVYLEDIKYSAGLSYTLKDVFYIGGTFRTENTAGGGTTTRNTNTDGRNIGGTIDENKNSSMFVGDLRLLAVPNLTAVVAIAADNIQDFGSNGLMFISETFAYKIDKLNLGLNAVQFLYQNDKDTGLLFNLWGSYTFDSVVPRLDLVYFINGTSHNAVTAQASANPNYHRRGYAPLSSAAEHSVLSIRPSVRINLDGRTHFEIGNVTHIDSAKTNIINWNDSKERITNVFYIDYKWSF
ncbi:MAG: hypothetical protein FWB77_05625 [Treponema sp.]|nr:hypothetical protein [Treponema sp.]